MKALQNVTVYAAETVTDFQALGLLIPVQLVSDCNQLKIIDNVEKIVRQ